MLKGKGSKKQEEQARKGPGDQEAPLPVDAAAASGDRQDVPPVEDGVPEGGGATESGGAGTRDAPAAETGSEAPGQEASEAARLTRELEQLQDKYLRLMADFENFKKRAAREKADLVQYGNETLLKDLLPVIDNIERVLAYSAQEGDWKEFQKGVELIVSEIHKTLAGHGVRSLDAVGVPFDPNLHEAMQRVETDRAAPDTVVEEFQKGYLLRDRLLRPSLVAVAVPGGGAAGPGGEAEGAADAPGLAGHEGAGAEKAGTDEANRG